MFVCLFAREQVMSGREWCTLEEWLQCRRPLCPLVVRHDGRVEHTSPSGRSPAAEPPVGIRVCFASRRVGGSFLDDGDSQVRRRRQRQKLNSTVYLCNVTKVWNISIGIGRWLRRRLATAEKKTFFFLSFSLPPSCCIIPCQMTLFPSHDSSILLRRAGNAAGCVSVLDNVCVHRHLYSWNGKEEEGRPSARFLPSIEIQ